MVKFILLADDDKDDRFFFNLAVAEINKEVRFETVKDGEQLMLWLIEHGDDLPDILFLDLNMPRKNGFVCLQEIRDNRRLQQLFIAVYSTSTSDKDVEEAFAKGANIFINKPNGFEDLKVIIRKTLALELEDYLPHVHNVNFVMGRN